MPDLTRREALLAAAAVAICPRARASREPAMHAAATSFLVSLTPAQRAKAQAAFEADERRNWHYVPIERRGLPYDEMTSVQRDAARSLLRSVLSDEGLGRVDAIRSLETVLLDLEQGKGPRRDPERYYFMAFGDPAPAGAWGWRYEGHHVSLNCTVLDGRLVASTPQFLGANPAEVRSGPMKGTRVLGAAEDLARELVASLTDRQRAVAIASPVAPPDIVTAAARHVGIQQQQGIGWRELTGSQQGMVRALIQEHASVQKPAVARARLASVRQGGIDGVRFAWMGGLDRGQGHYYRIQAASFLIEYDCTQDNANHIHTVWREFAGDWGEDALARHYSPGGHHAG